MTADVLRLPGNSETARWNGETREERTRRIPPAIAIQCLASRALNRAMPSLARLVHSQAERVRFCSKFFVPETGGCRVYSRSGITNLPAICDSVSK